ncbi:MAG TPA: trehalose-phosphatase [Rhizobiaceae bacterium]|nr:trehalose-phosphatase [Rhizobiaceae bacterium]
MQVGSTVTDRQVSAISVHPYLPALPDRLDGHCLFLDLDGTLLDLAEAPDAVVVPPGLQAHLGTLSVLLGGALALVTGRPLAFVERLFPGNDFFLAGLHGAEMRNAQGGQPSAAAGDRRLEAAKEQLRHLASKWPGVLVEDKGPAVALHYRQAPEMESAVRALMRETASSVPGWTLQTGKFVVELRPAGRDKGDAIRTFMEHSPFSERSPLAIGDDVTDEQMFAAANAMGGTSFRVGPRSATTVARGRIETPGEVRRWIEKLVS